MKKQVDINEVAKNTGRSAEEVKTIIQCALTALTPITKTVTICEGGKMIQLSVTRMGVGIINTEYGFLWEYEFQINDKWEKYVVIFKGEVDDDLNLMLKDQEQLLMRTDSGCESGQVFGDRTCECREQLHLAMKEIADHGEGLIVHIPNQDGRGMGMPFKLSTLYLQEMLGFDTVESATVVSQGEEFDIRTYGGVVAILKWFGITTTTHINLATNNPRKVSVFGENGYMVDGMEPIVAPITDHTRKHLLAKQEHLGHINLVPETG